VRTRIILITVLGLALAGTVILATASDEDSGRPGGTGAPVVAAGFYPLAYGAEQLGGPGAEVANLTPPGAEPHDLEVSAEVVEQLRSADLVLLMGRGFQPQLEDAADRAPGEVIEILETPGLTLRDDDDPHVWLDPIRYGGVLKRIADALGPGELEAMVARLRQLDGEYRAGLSDCERRELVTSHESFGYLADRYGLRQVAITGLSPEAEPSPGELTDVVEEVRRAGATTVFSEALVSPRLAETVARETGAETEVLNTIEGLTSDQEADGEDYFSLMRENLDKIREGLGCR
jgi:zinc transport system substrate-binding protein